MSPEEPQGVKPMTVVKIVGAIVVIILAFMIWDKPSRRGGGTVGDRVVGKAIAMGLIMIPVVGIGYLLSRKGSNDTDDDGGGDSPAPRP